jgi:hypothetical protein
MDRLPFLLLAPLLVAVPALGQNAEGSAPTPPEAASHRAPQASHPALVSPQSPPRRAHRGDLLYTNGPLINSIGTGVGGADESILQEPAHLFGYFARNSQDHLLADDFRILPGQAWTLDQIVFYAFQHNAPPPPHSSFTGVFVEIFDGDPAAGGTVIYGDLTTNVMESTAWTGAYRVEEATSGTNTTRAIMEVVADVNVTLTEGTYWVAFNFTGTVPSFESAPPVATFGSCPAGNGQQLLAGEWSPLTNFDCPPGDALPFEVLGTRGTPYLTITVEPHDPPILIPPDGGSFQFTATLTNTTDEPQAFQAWTAVTGPADREPVMGPLDVTLAPGAVLTRTLTQRVPAQAPPGVYTYTARIGVFGGTIVSSDGFTFIKEPPAAGAPVPAGDAQTDWAVRGWIGASPPVSASADVPEALALYAARPNPSAERTTLTFDLRETSPVRLAVYDVLGREVAVLVDGEREAGRHEAVLDGSRLSAGTYLVRLEAGSHVARQRVTLVR